MQNVRKLSATDNRVRLAPERKVSSGRSSLDTVRYGGLPGTEVSSAGSSIGKSARIREMFTPQERTNYIRTDSTTRTTCVRPHDEHNGPSSYRPKLYETFSHAVTSPYVYVPTNKAQRSFDSDEPDKDVEVGVLEKYYTMPLKKSTPQTNVSINLFNGSSTTDSPKFDKESVRSSVSSITSKRELQSSRSKEDLVYPLNAEVSVENGTFGYQSTRCVRQETLRSSEKKNGPPVLRPADQPNGFCILNSPRQNSSRPSATENFVDKPLIIETSSRTMTLESTTTPSKGIQIKQTGNSNVSRSETTRSIEYKAPRTLAYTLEKPPPYSISTNNQSDVEGHPTVVVSYSNANKEITIPQKPPETPIGFDTPHRGPHVGLLNHGNTCYMSVIFQCLRFTPSLYTLCTNSADIRKSGKLCASLSELFNNMAKQASHQELYRNVETIRTIMGGFSSLYSGSEQQDATEFLTCMLDMLHSEMKPSGFVGNTSNLNNNSGNNVSSFNTPPSLADYSSCSTDPWSSDTNVRETRGHLVRTRTPPEAEKSKSITPGTIRRHLKRFIQKGAKKGFSTKKTFSHACIDPPAFNECGRTTDAGKHPAIQAWEEENKSEASNIRETFMSQLQTYRRCNQCNAEKLYFSVVWNLGVPIPRSSSNNKDNSFPVPISVISNSQTALDDGKRYGGSPSIPGQSDKVAKSIYLFDGSKSQSPSSNKDNSFPVPISVISNSQTGLEDDKRYSGSPSMPGQSVKVAKSINLFDGSNTQESVSPITYRKHDSPYVQFAQSNLPNGESPSPYKNSAPVHSSPVYNAQPPPLGAAPPPYSATARPPVTPVPLKDCINAFMLTEVLDGADRPMCAPCKQKTACVLHHSISRLPDVLIIQLLRFCCGERRQKIDVPVVFEKKLDMEDYIKSEYEKQHKFVSPSVNENDHTYWLYAVVYHDGAMSYGHYTAACRTTTGSDPNSDQWYHFDYEIVKEIKPEDVHKSSAYLLFYERDSLYQQRKNTVSKSTALKCTEGSGSQPTLRMYETQV